MVTDFNQIIDRKHSDSIKWNFAEEDVLPLWVADTDFAAPQAVIDQLHDRIEHGVFGYAKDSQALIAAIIEHLQSHFQWQVQADEIILMPGVVPAVNLACQSMAKEGDGIMIHPPVYGPFFQLGKNGGFELQEVNLQQNEDASYYLDMDDFKQAIRPNTRVFSLCNPHNPVGRVYTKSELEQMAQICLEHNIIISSDEIHADLIFNGYKHIPIASLSPEISQQTITLMAPSKTFNIAGLDCAFTVIQNEALRKQYLQSRKGLFGHVNLLGQTAALAAYQHGQSWLKELMRYLEGNRDIVAAFIKDELPAIKMSHVEGTYLAWLDCRNTSFAENPAEFFLKNARVMLNDGTFFGEAGKGFVRLNFGCPTKTLQEGLSRLKLSMQ
ncbi:MAG: PatB family C-S lyase [Anaerolineaceae bacterium]|nr:PatB family C-S lyase [Anaerolineaceae bacterium]